MVVHRKIVQVIEMDVDYCSQTFGVSPCMAALSGTNVRKCYNTFGTCAYTQAYTKTVKTLKFIEASYHVKDGNYLPYLVKVDGHVQEVNIAGYTANIGGLGVRADMSVSLWDFPYRDTLTDKYWAERISGVAQTDESGYDPMERGSFWTKFKARNPNYSGRPMRVIQAHIDDAGSVVYDKVRHYVMDEFKGPDKSGNVTIKIKDALSLADDEKALCPKPNTGLLLANMDASQTTFTLSPAGIGDGQYPASGVLTIGSEIMIFTRAADVMSVVRGQRSTQPATHTANDSVQVAFDIYKIRADLVIKSLLVDYGNIPASNWPDVETEAEFSRWGSSLVLTATICKPTGVSKLVGEINLLGIAVFSDEVAQKIKAKLSHPPDDVPVEWTDDSNVMSIITEDNDDQRATRILISTMQIDPTKEIANSNFLRIDEFISVGSESPDMFGLPRTKQIFCRWLNHGAANVVKIQGMRLLNRYKRAPVTYKVTVDQKDDVNLTDVVGLTSYVTTDITGKQLRRLAQVYKRADNINGSSVTVDLQMFQFDERYGKIAHNDYPLYTSATAEQKLHGSFFVGPSLVFADGGKPYQFV